MANAPQGRVSTDGRNKWRSMLTSDENAFSPRPVGVAVDLAGCPNRCRHWYLGNGPNGRLPAEVLREVAEAFWHWAGSGEGAGRFQQVDVASWYREPNFADNYRDLYNPTDAKARWVKLACAG